MKAIVMKDDLYLRSINLDCVTGKVTYLWTQYAYDAKKYRDIKKAKEVAKRTGWKAVWFDTLHGELFPL